MSDSKEPEKPEPTPVEVAALERLAEHYRHVAAGVAAAQLVDAHRVHLVWCFTKGFLIAVVGIPALMLLLLLFLSSVG